MTIETNARPSVHDQVLVEAEIGDRVAGFRAVVINVMPECLWLGLLKPDPLLEQIRPGDLVVLTFRCNRAAMVASETFLSHLGTGQTRFFSVRWSEGVEVVQRRAYLRMNAECPIDFTVINSDFAEPGQTLSGVTRNLSAAGLLFRIGVPMASTVAVGDLVEIKVSLGSGVVFADARVVRIEDATDLGPDGKPVPPTRATHRPVTHIAVQFEHIPEAAQDRIVRYIFFLQRAKRDNRPGRLKAGYSSGARW